MIRIGQRLSIYVLPTYNSETKDLYRVPAKTSTTVAKSSNRRIPSGNGKTYEVQLGDTLWQIARDTNKTVEELKKLNNLRNSRITAGQTLVISGK